MSNDTYGTKNTHAPDRFEHHSEDADCAYCANFRKGGEYGCGRSKCEFQDLRDEHISKGRIKRKKRIDEWAE
jgi:hypothetical protein